VGDADLTNDPMNIRDHTLAWRWTDRRYALFSEAVLAQMQPVEADEAARLCSRSLTFEGEDGLAESVFSVTTAFVGGMSQETGCRWLRELQPDVSVEVAISWDQSTAIRTTWEIFTAQWDDFCYPASDDAHVWPLSENWVLRYHHIEEFQFGRRRGA